MKLVSLPGARLATAERRAARVSAGIGMSGSL